MEDRTLPITIGQGAGAKIVTLDLPPFTLIGATTRAGLLTTPLRDRFGIQHRLESYDAEDLARIVRRSAGILGIELDDGGALGDRGAQPRDAARREPAAQAGARLGGGARQRRRRRGGGRRGARRSSRSTTSASTASTARSSRPSARSSAAGRSACRRSRSPSARRPTRSRTSTSPTCCSAGCCSAPRAAARPPRARTSTSAWRRRARPRRSSESTRGACENAAGTCALPPESARASAQTGPLTPTRRGSAYPVLSAWPTSSSARTAGRARTNRNAHAGSPANRPPVASAGSRSFSSCSTTTTRLPTRHSSCATREGRVIRCGRGSFELTGLDDERVIGRPVREVLGLRWSNGDDPVNTVLEWGVRALEQARRGQRGGRPAGSRHRRPLSRLRRRRRAASRAHAGEIAADPYSA